MPKDREDAILGSGAYGSTRPTTHGTKRQERRMRTRASVRRGSVMRANQLEENPLNR